MKAYIYSIRDLKMNKYGLPYSAANNDIAKRMLASTMWNGKNQLNMFAEDFQLFKLGSYDDDTGELITENEFICNATEFKKGGENGVSDGMESKE